MKIEVRADKERMKKFCPLDDIIGLQSSDFNSIKNILAKFILDPKTHEYYPVEIVDTDDEYLVKPDPRALELIGRLPLERIMLLIADFRGKVSETAAPPPSAESSTPTT